MKSSIRAFLRHAWVYTLYLSGCLAWAKRQVIASGGTVGLTFHRVLPVEERRISNSPSGMVLSVETFASLVEYVSRKCIAVDLKGPDLPAGRERAKPRIAITFDDGWLDNAAHAAPILLQTNLPYVIFLCSEKMGKTLPFWPERVAAIRKAAERSGKLAKFTEIVNQGLKTPLTQLETQSSAALIERIKQLQREQRENLLHEMDTIEDLPKLLAESNCDATMSWEVAHQLAAEGVRFGSHTVHHEILTCVPEAEAIEEIEESGRAIEASLGQPCRLFAYPNGNWSPGIKACVAKAGYEFAFANKPGIWTQETDHWIVPRCNIWEGAVAGMLGKFSSIHFDYVVFWKSVKGFRSARKVAVPNGHGIQTAKRH